MPGVNAKLEDAKTWVEPGNETLTFRAAGQAGSILVPINEIVHQRYDVYWKLTPPRPTFNFGNNS